jgi:hypothetical protein
MKIIILIFFVLVFFIGCYNESDYSIDNEKNKSSFVVKVDNNAILADSFSFAQITVLFDKSIDTIKALTTFKTTLGTFIESNSMIYSTKPKYNFDFLKFQQ